MKSRKGAGGSEVVLWKKYPLGMSSRAELSYAKRTTTQSKDRMSSNVATDMPGTLPDV